MEKSPLLSTPRAAVGPGVPLILRVFQILRRRWFSVFIIFLGIYVFLPFLAPVFMQVGWRGPARAIYLIYSFQCHQLPQRSYFLFGPQLTYSLAEVQEVWQNTIDPMILRQFIGSPEMGWKVAWSDRMVSMYASTLLFALIWRALRSHLRPLSIWGFALALLPMALDGSSHFVSDIAGFGGGFRDSNAWMAAITGNAFSTRFYFGDGWGSFNSIMRLLSGLIFGLGVAWFGMPYIAAAMENQSQKTDGDRYTTSNPPAQVDTKDV